MFIKKLTKQVICNPDEPVVSTPNGKLRGLIVDDTYIFRGIKYADARRFHMPTPVKAWEGVKEVLSTGRCALKSRPYSQVTIIRCRMCFTLRMKTVSI